MKSNISLEKARKLVELLENGEQEVADALFQELVAPNKIESELYEEIGRLTRQLHSALTEFQIDNRLVELVKNDIHDSGERLNSVIGMTEQAANKTMDAVEDSLPIVKLLNKRVEQIGPIWLDLMDGKINLEEFKQLSNASKFFEEIKRGTDNLKESLDKILIAQDYQDLTGQMIKKVINLIQEIEANLVRMLIDFQDKLSIKRGTIETKQAGIDYSIVNAHIRSEVVIKQSDVDDLLDSLGF